MNLWRNLTSNSPSDDVLLVFSIVYCVSLANPISAGVSVGYNGYVCKIGRCSEFFTVRSANENREKSLECSRADTLQGSVLQQQRG
jgi:hypothetical protein